MSISAAKKIKDIEDPDCADLIKALKNKIYKTWQEEEQLRTDLWHSLNDTTRTRYAALSGEKKEIWKANCAALLPLVEKTLKEMRLEKNSKKYDDDDRTHCLIMTAELNRNLGNYNECMNIIKELKSSLGWLKKQYNQECKEENPFTFELLSKSKLASEKNKKADKYDYIEQVKKYLTQNYGRKDAKKALAAFNKAVKLGMNDMDFYRNRGLLYLNDLNDYDSAIADFTKALSLSPQYSELFKADILNFRSSAYQKKGDTAAAEADKKAAIKLNKRSTEGTESDLSKEEKLRRRQLEKLYKQGKAAFVAKKYAKAEELLNLAAEQGSINAQFSLGILYSSAMYKKEDKAKSLYWYEKAAEQGHIQAQFSMGNYYDRGTGVRENKSKTVYWWTKAAEQGNRQAQSLIGAYYFDGVGVAKDEGKAAYWWTLAAEEGITSAQRNLGIIYLNGTGVPKDKDKALYWLKKSAEDSDIQALDILNQLNNRETPTKAVIKMPGKNPKKKGSKLKGKSGIEEL
jgi:TPR repeat protein